MARSALLAALAALLALAGEASALPKGEDEQPPPPPSGDISQHEIDLEGIPPEFLLQQPIDDKLAELDVPFLVQGDPQLSAPFSPRGRRPTCSGGPRCSRRPPLPNLEEFPPARPTAGNVGKICADGRRKLSYGPWNLPQTSYSHLARQGEALNSLEEGVRQCCQRPQDEKLPCCSGVWERVLAQYCQQEFSVKDRRHYCCNKETGQPDYRCFASDAPYPLYDKEIRVLSLAEVTPELLDSLCGQVTLLTKQKNIPALIQNITEPCCPLEGQERTQCAEDAKSEFIATICGPQRSTWKDPKRCCSQTEDAARGSCFDRNYLAQVPVASPAPTVRPTEPAS